MNNIEVTKEVLHKISEVENATTERVQIAVLAVIAENLAYIADALDKIGGSNG